jgi:hypothetical protein
MIQILRPDLRARPAARACPAWKRAAVWALGPVTLLQLQGASGLFEEVLPPESGVNFTHRLALDHPHSYLYESGYACGGVSIGDVDADGLPDVLLVSGPGENVLYLNQGKFVFRKSPSAAVLEDGQNWGVSSTFADLDGDGDLDLLLVNYGAQNKVFLNDGKGQFRDVTAASGMSYAGPSQAIYPADFDNDGDLDLFLLTNRFYSRSGRPRGVASELGSDGQPHIKKEYAPFLRIVRPESEVPARPGVTTETPPPPFMLEYGHPDRLYRNDGVGADGVPRFTDVTSGSALMKVAGHGLSALIWDVNGDGLPDIYVANDYTDPDSLWINQGINSKGEFQFRDAIAEHLPYTSWSSMGSDLADINGDGRLDFLVADMAGSTHEKAQRTSVEINGWRRWVAQNAWPRQTMRNTLFLGSGVDRFQEAAFEAGVARTDWTWAVKFGDFDLDGLPDVFLTTGAARLFTDSDIIVTPAMLVGTTLWEAFKNTSEGREQNFAFRNQDGLHFSDVSKSWNLDKLSMSFAAATADLDADGDLDLVVCHLDEPVSLYRNRAAESEAHWLKVRLHGEKNRFGVGALVTARLSDGRALLRLMNPYTGFLSGNEPMLHFGLGRESTLRSLEVRWPSGKIQVLNSVGANRSVDLQEADAVLPATNSPSLAALKAPPSMLESASRLGLEFTHREQAFDDYHREPLLPAKLSQAGPGLAVADVNGDLLDDVFVGGASGQAGVLFLHQPDHTFKRLGSAPWDRYSTSEDMGALFFDADRDGDLDLYVVSGSNEWEPQDSRYADHLYLNETARGSSDVRFMEAPEGSIPAARQAGSCVVAADFDLDGDLDLFVGAKSIPGSYPTPGDSLLLRNDGRRAGEVKFIDVTELVAPGLRKIGMVNSALWSDVDSDGRPDLLVACEWGPVSLYLNRGGELARVRDQEGIDLAARLGWWNSIVPADIDADGDIDFLVLNAGTNTKYGAPTPERPLVLFYGDMDGNEVAEIIEARMGGRGLLPVRARHPSSQAVPLINDRFPTYRGFASATLDEIYGEESLKRALRLTASELASGVLRNESSVGKVRLTWIPLPAQAQLSPGFGAAALFGAGEGGIRLAIAQNSDAREVETGLWRSGVGCMLEFRGAQSPRAVDPAQTGFVVRGDGKALAVTDLNGDGFPDLLATQNNDALLAFQSTLHSLQDRVSVAVTLRGPAGNPQGVGARVSLVAADGQLAGTTEVRAGEGYLSQSSATVYLEVSAAARPRAAVRVRWNDGKASEIPIPVNTNRLFISVP